MITTKIRIQQTNKQTPAQILHTMTKPPHLKEKTSHHSPSPVPEHTRSSSSCQHFWRPGAWDPVFQNWSASAPSRRIWKRQSESAFKGCVFMRGEDLPVLDIVRICYPRPMKRRKRWLGFSFYSDCQSKRLKAVGLILLLSVNMIPLFKARLAVASSSEYCQVYPRKIVLAVTTQWNIAYSPITVSSYPTLRHHTRASTNCQLLTHPQG